MRSFHFVVLQETAKKCTEMLNERAEGLFLLIQPIVLRRCRRRRRRHCLSFLFFGREKRQPEIRLHSQATVLSFLISSSTL